MQNNGVFEFKVKDAAGKEAFWTIDLKKTGTVKKGEAKSLGMKPDVTIILSDDTFIEIAEGKTTGQKAFMTGALKTKGNMMLATKLDGVLKVMPNAPPSSTANGCTRARGGKQSYEPITVYAVLMMFEFINVRFSRPCAQPRKVIVPV